MSRKSTATTISTREKTEPPRRKTLTESEFREKYHFSKTKFFDMRVAGTAPRIINFGRQHYVTNEDEEAWYRDVFLKSEAPLPYSSKSRKPFA